MSSPSSLPVGLAGSFQGPFGLPGRLTNQPFSAFLQVKLRKKAACPPLPKLRERPSSEACARFTYPLRRGRRPSRLLKGQKHVDLFFIRMLDGKQGCLASSLPRNEGRWANTRLVRMRGQVSRCPALTSCFWPVDVFRHPSLPLFLAWFKESYGLRLEYFRLLPMKNLFCKSVVFLSSRNFLAW